MSLENEIKQAEAKAPVEKPAYAPIYKMTSAAVAVPKEHKNLDALLLARQKANEPKDYPGNPLYVRGKTVMHLPTRAPVTILKCEGVGKSGIAEYLVVSKKGKKWTAKESDLRPKPSRT